MTLAQEKPHPSEKIPLVSHPSYEKRAVDLEQGKKKKTAIVDGSDEPQCNSTWWLGIACVICVAIIWNFASLIVQHIFHDLGFQAPFFLTYVSTSLFTILLPIEILATCMGCKSRQDSAEPRVLGTFSKEELTRTARLSAFIAPLWFTSHFVYNASLNLTSMTSSTIVSCTSSMFTFGFSVMIIKEQFSCWKLVGVLVCMMGNVLTVFKDQPSSKSVQSSPLTGDVFALAGAILYGFYTTMLRKLNPGSGSINIPLFFGLVGLITFVTVWPLVLVMHFSRFEPLDDLTWYILGWTIFKGLFDNVLSNVLWAKAVLLTSPTVATVGLSLTIPLAIVSDRIVSHIVPNWATYASSICVLIGFAVINLSTVKKI